MPRPAGTVDDGEVALVYAPPATVSANPEPSLIATLGMIGLGLGGLGMIGLGMIGLGLRARRKVSA